MITSINLSDKVPFSSSIAMLDDLNKVNFVFGPNGSGKTTISRLIAAEAPTAHPAHLAWENDAPVKTYVYNRDFVETNFQQRESVPGVFTMGEDSVQAQRDIEDFGEKIQRETQKLQSDESTLKDKQDEITDNDEHIRDACWDVKRQLPEQFGPALKGYSRSKDSFRDRTLEVLEGLGADVKTVPDSQPLCNKASIVFDDTASEIAPPPTVSFEELLRLESAPVLSKAIVGKEDIPIAALINELGNGDWVAAGRRYIRSGSTCPFCQQPTLTNDLKGQIERFFDGSYKEGINELNRVAERYSAVSTSLSNQIEEVLRSYGRFATSVPELRAALEKLKRITQENLSTINSKKDQPGISVELTSSQEACDELSRLLAHMATNVSDYNKTVANRRSERSALTADIWTYIAMKAKPLVEPCQRQKVGLSKAAANLKTRIGEHRTRINGWKTEQEAAEKRITNVKATADIINDLLARFGFTNFKLDVADDKSSYRIIRENGESARNTLSEGEYSFLTFLYFYNLMNGSQESSGVTDKRIVVIDDPITSMDADVLFVVSSLVRELAHEARDGSGTVDQLIVLTHNITFHREITYVRADGGNAKTSYYVISKAPTHSIVERCDKIPVCSTYELLWQDLYSPDCKPLTAQNVSRRIIETFFKLMGGLKVENVVKEMGTPDREIARSFLSWANSGSHSPFDDETFVNTSATTDHYRRVLETIFEVAGYPDHCTHMIDLVKRSQSPG